MPHLALRLLGPTLVTLDGHQVERFGYDKVLALLVYLAVEADRAHRRDALGELLWPDRPPGVARNNLRQALVTLRQAIGDAGAEPPFLRTTRESLQLDPASDYSCDVTATMVLYGSVTSHSHLPGALCQGCVAQLQQVVELYRGDFFRTLADELGVEPDALTTALCEQIRIGVIAPPAVSFAPRGAPPQSNLPAPPTWRLS